MSTLTVYPVAGANSPCDGRVYNNATAGNWAALRADTDGAGTDVTSTDQVIQGEWFAGGPLFFLTRWFLNFDTSSLGAGATITSAVLSIYTLGTGNNSETTYPANAALVGATPASTATVATTDFPNVGTTRYADSDILASNVVGAAAGYKDWTLNAAGLAALNKTGVTSFGIRCSNDFSDSTIPTARSYWGFYQADNASNKPKLVITYTAPTTAIKSINGLAKASVKSINGLTIASVKSWNGLA